MLILVAGLACLVQSQIRASSSCRVELLYLGAGLKRSFVAIATLLLGMGVAERIAHTLVLQAILAARPAYDVKAPTLVLLMAFSTSVLPKASMVAAMLLDSFV